MKVQGERARLSGARVESDQTGRGEHPQSVGRPGELSRLPLVGLPDVYLRDRRDFERLEIDGVDAPGITPYGHVHGVAVR